MYRKRKMEGREEVTAEGRIWKSKEGSKQGKGGREGERERERSLTGGSTESRFQNY